MIFEIFQHENGTCHFVFDNVKFDGYEVWNMMESAFPDNRKPGMEYYGLHCYGQYENAILFVQTRR